MSYDVDSLPVRARALGEGPVWHDGMVFWVDIYDGAVHACSLDGTDSLLVQADEPVTAIAPSTNGPLVVATASGVSVLTSATLEPMWRYPRTEAGLRLNDGKADPFGRFIVGSMCEDETNAKPRGELFRLAPDLRAAAVVRSDVLISNGLAWSADGTQMFHVDTGAKSVSVFRYDAQDGPIEMTRRFRTDAVPGWPDGMTMDTDGGLWIAFWDGSCIARFRPDGRLDATIELPVPRPTSVTFGGDRLDVLIATTASHDLKPQQLTDHPLSGCLFVISGAGSGHDANCVTIASSVS